MRRTSTFAFATAILIAVCGCNKGKPGGPEASGEKGSGPTAPENIRQLKELRSKDVKQGVGAPVKNGDHVFVTYTGKLKNGIQFDSNDRPDGTPLGFVIGARGVIPGWDIGVVGMKVGGVRKLEVPNELAYGDNSQGDKVPAGADLYFEIELLDVVRMGEEDLFDKKDIVVGSGKACKVGDTVEVLYTMKLVNNRIVDTFEDKAKPVVFRLGPKLADGDREVPRGIVAAMVGMKEGGKRHMRIPPRIGFSYSSNPKLPPNGIVLIDMTLLKVR